MNLSKTKFNKSQLQYVNSQVKIYDKNNKLMNEEYLSTNQTISLNKVPEHVKQAFISIEDKNFYKHKGLNYKRILKAIITNISTMSFKEGASTISQQLIKNTHLSSKKTISRKIDEILLTQKLERNFSKDEILQAYLNVIYFGSGTFGIEQASQKYFSKSASELSLDEGAILAGIIKSPKLYSPIINPENCIKRRNQVLKEMFLDQKISKQQYDEARNKPLNLKINELAVSNNDYVNASVAEACDILGISEKDLVVNEYKIYTYLDTNIQDTIKSNLQSLKIQNNPDRLAMVIENSTGAISGYYGVSKYDLLNTYRQPGSTIKPIIAYVPALEYNLITPNTKILDEPFCIGEYKPKNYKGIYNGWTNIEYALTHSLNIPAVKTLEYVGIDKAKSFAKKLGIDFAKNDNGYSLALGGMTKGVTVKQLANSYIPFANNGEFVEAKFISKIENKYGRTIYKHIPKKATVMRDDTAYLITEMLSKTVSEGTGKKLSDLNMAIACKTGTVGSSIDNTNTDAFNVCYTPDNVVCCWIGNTSGDSNLNLNQGVTGAIQPTLVNKEILKKLPKKQSFNKPNSVVELDINLIDYEQNNIINLATPNTPQRYIKKMIFSKYNIPKTTSQMFNSIQEFKISLISEKDSVKISIPCLSFLKYDLYKITEGKKKLLIKIEDKKGIYEYIDKDIKEDTWYEYYVTAYLDVDIGTINRDSNKLILYKQDKKTISNNEIVWE